MFNVISNYPRPYPILLVGNPIELFHFVRKVIYAGFNTGFCSKENYTISEYFVYRPKWLAIYISTTVCMFEGIIYLILSFLKINIQKFKRGSKTNNARKKIIHFRSF